MFNVHFFVLWRLTWFWTNIDKRLAPTVFIAIPGGKNKTAVVILCQHLFLYFSSVRMTIMNRKQGLTICRSLNCFERLRQAIRFWFAIPSWKILPKFDSLSLTLNDITFNCFAIIFWRGGPPCFYSKLRNGGTFWTFAKKWRWKMAHVKFFLVISV